MNEKNVFVYWIGPSFSLVDLLRKMMQYHANNGQHYTLHIINETNLFNYVSDLPNHFHQLNPAYRADYVRVAVVERFGGIWLDSDTLVMNNLHELFKVFDTHQGFFIQQNNEILCNGVFGSRAATPLMTAWRQAIFQRIEQQGPNLEWSELGNLWLDQTYHSTQLFNNYHIYRGLDTMYPVNWDHCVAEFLQKPYPHYQTLIRPFQPLLVLVNSVYRALENKSIPEILSGNYPLNYFIKESIRQGLPSNSMPSNDSFQ